MDSDLQHRLAQDGTMYSWKGIESTLIFGIMNMDLWIRSAGEGWASPDLPTDDDLGGDNHMFKSVWFSIATAILCFSAVSATQAAVVAAFDYGAGDIFPDFTQVSNVTGSATDSGVGISVTGGTEYRTRGEIVGDPLSDLLYDLAFENDTSSIVFTLTGLAANTDYSVTVYAYDSESGNNNKVTSWSTNGGPVQVIHTTNSSDPSTAPFALTLTSDGLGGATIEAATTGNIILWNGLSIETSTVPVPAPLAMGLAGLAMLVTRRRHALPAL